MLKNAYNYMNTLEKLHLEAIDNDKNKFYYLDGYQTFTMDLAKDDWNCFEKVSVNKDDNVIGYFRCNISRVDKTAYSLAAINFYDTNVTFARDLKEFIYYIFLKKKIKKLNWSGVINNPIRKSYDKYCEKYHGRIIGVKKDHICIDSQQYDLRVYELSRKNFLLSLLK